MNSWVPLDGPALAMMGKMVIHTSAMKVSIFQTVVHMPGKAHTLHSTTLIVKSLSYKLDDECAQKTTRSCSCTTSCSKKCWGPLALPQSRVLSWKWSCARHDPEVELLIQGCQWWDRFISDMVAWLLCHCMSLRMPRFDLSPGVRAGHRQGSERVYSWGPDLWTQSWS